MNIRYVLIPFYWLCMLTLSAQKVKFVNANATGAQTGQNWIDAYVDLQQAIATAVRGDTIWVAQGIYKPGNDRNQSFLLVSGVQLYGGFSGFETALEQRNPDLFETTLSADIGEPGVDTDNNYHVFTGFGVDSLTVIDGFTIRDAYAIDYDIYPGGEGGGIQLYGSPEAEYSNPRISNCHFINNKAQKGGAIFVGWFYNDFFGYHRVNPVIAHCIFENNLSFPFDGGAICWDGLAEDGDTIELSDCIFKDNWAIFERGAHVSFKKVTGSIICIKNCLFDRDSSGYGSVDFLLKEQSNRPSNFLIENCSFLNKHGDASVGALSVYCTTPIEIKVDINNCLFNNNRNRGGRSVLTMEGTENSKIHLYVNNSNISNNIGTSIYLLTGNLNANFKNCNFINNNKKVSQSIEPQMLYVRGGTNYIAETKFDNCLFANNGAGLEFSSNQDVFFNTEINNCTFYQNNQYTFSKSYYPSYSQPGYPYFNRMKIRNSIIWETETLLPFANSSPFVFQSKEYFIENTLFDSNWSSSFNDPNLKNKYVKSPLFLDSLSGDFRLRPCAPGVNAGNNIFADSLSTDLAGVPRILFGNVDMGAYEAIDTCTIVAIDNPRIVLSINVSPNPSKGPVQFSLPENALIDRLEVLNTSGKMVLQRNTFHTDTVDLTHEPQGIYWMRIYSGSSVYVGKWLRL